MSAQFAWHIHDDVLVEPAVELIENRRAFIRKHKLPEEVELRLRLLQPVRGKLPDAVIRAGATWGGFNIGLDESAYYRSLKDHRAELEALHAQECPGCPWDGETIFPKGAV